MFLGGIIYVFMSVVKETSQIGWLTFKNEHNYKIHDDT